MKILNFLVIFLLLVVSCPAADLKDLQELALTNRRVLEKYRTNLEMAGQDQTIARSPFLPSANLSYTANMLDDDALFENRENSVVYGAISWNLFAGWRDRYNLNAAGFRYDAEAEKLAAIRQDIMLNVALRYLAIYAGRANLQVAQDSYYNLEKVYQDAENRLQVGLIKKNDLLKFKVDLDNAAITLKKAEAEVTREQRFLSREVGPGPIDLHRVYHLAAAG
jgi:outer membrane protein